MITQIRTAEIAKAREVDSEIARLWNLYHDVNDKATAKLKEKAYLSKHLRNKNLSASGRTSREERVAVLTEEIAALREEAEAAMETAIAYDKANYEGWSRFFHVVHIHASQHCSSFRPTTRVGWLPNVSGLTEAEAVAEHGALLCTICFPSAPTELTTPKVDDSVCPGSGRPYSQTHKTGREHTYYSKTGFCRECDTIQTVTSTGLIRKHKKPTN